ncbi:DUF5819 family protein [Streptomyces sp. NPDC059708]|uniref:DUF5819 family protein n=1 Tax=Streptomyces sp. NPDC059708 TaxID=3346916 RepID=UPI003680111A
MESYLRNIAVERVPAHGRGSLDSIQLRVITRPVTPSNPSGGTRPAVPIDIRHLPWWKWPPLYAAAALRIGCGLLHLLIIAVLLVVAGVAFVATRRSRRSHRRSAWWATSTTGSPASVLCARARTGNGSSWSSCPARAPTPSGTWLPVTAGSTARAPVTMKAVDASLTPGVSASVPGGGARRGPVARPAPRRTRRRPRRPARTG